MSPKDLYNVLSAVFPLYFAMFLAYASVKYFKLFTPEQCSGINRFVAIFAIPFLSFNFITKINPFHLNLIFIAADSLSKVFVLFLLFNWAKFFKNGSLDWSITLFSVTTLPNTLVMGIPLLKSMYGEEQGDLMIQVVVMQSIIWYTLLLFLFEYRAARNSLREKMSSDGVGDLEGGIVEEELTQVVVCNSLSENEIQKSQFVNKVAPELVEEEGEEVKTSEKLSEIEEQSKQQGIGESSVQVCRGEEEGKEEDEKPKPGKLSMLLILRMVYHKLIRNPNTYASVFGLAWALISSRWNLKKPLIMENSITILSNVGQGMAMFSLGLFMAKQSSLIPCGKKMAILGMIIRFVAGPAFMVIAAYLLGIRGTLLKVSIVQAALPQGIVPFVFAMAYHLHPEILSTQVIFGMIVAFPVTILYYMVLGS